MTPKSPSFTEAQARALIAKAEAAGERAFKAAKPTTMYVGTPKDPIASLMGGDGGGLDPDKDIYIVNDGVCGFAWINIRPANCSFARRAKAIYTAGGESYRAHKGYYGGLEIRPVCLGRTQSYERQMAAVRAYAAILQEAGVTAYPDGRLD